MDPAITAGGSPAGTDDGTGEAILAFEVARTHVSGRRYAAHLIDSVIFWLLALVPLIAAAVISSAALALTLLFLLLPGPVVYYVLTQRRSGQSPGKRAVGIEVVTASGDVPSRTALTKRTLPLLFEYVLLLAGLAMMSSDVRQRFGDRWARTYVIDAEASGEGR